MSNSAAEVIVSLTQITACVPSIAERHSFADKRFPSLYTEMGLLPQFLTINTGLTTTSSFRLGVSLLEQLTQFPVAKHDDGPDALEMAMQASQNSGGHWTTIPC